MPYYYFVNNEGVEETHFMSISEYDRFVTDHPTYKQLIKGPAFIGDPVRQGVTKPSTEFRERLQEIKKTHYKSNINDW